MTRPRRPRTWAALTHRDKAVAAMLASAGLVVTLGWWHSWAAHLPLWHGMYCALAEATTDGGDCPLGGVGYLVVVIEFFTILPLFALSLTLFTTHFVNQALRQHTAAIKDHVTAAVGGDLPPCPPGRADPAAARPLAAARQERPGEGLMRLHLYPAVIIGALNAVIALVVSFGFLSPTAAHYVTTVATAVLGLVVALTTRPVVIGTVSTLFATILTGIAGFGVHMTDAQIGAVTTIATLLVTFFVHRSATPVAAWNKGTTADVLEREARVPAGAAR